MSAWSGWIDGDRFQNRSSLERVELGKVLHLRLLHCYRRKCSLPYWVIQSSNQIGKLLWGSSGCINESWRRNRGKWGRSNQGEGQTSVPIWAICIFQVFPILLRTSLPLGLPQVMMGGDDSMEKITRSPTGFFFFTRVQEQFSKG